MLTRREFVTTAAGLSLSGIGLSSAATRASREPRFVLVLLRGGMDGLSAVVPYGDPAYAARRGKLAIAAPGQRDGAFRLDDVFGLHPKLSALGAMFQRGELSVIPAVANAYHTRSHFDAQNVLDLGLSRPHAAHDGWLNRALALLPHRTDKPNFAMSLGHAMPLVLQGAQPVSSWSPDRHPDPDEDTWQRLLKLYERDAFLHGQLAQAIDAQAMVGGSATAMKARRRDASALFRAAGSLLARADGPRLIVLEVHGWDTHAQQGAASGRLANQFGRLSMGLATLAKGAGDAWSQTVGLAVSEFGRTVNVNGTGGTDHGTAGAGLIFGGGVRGGQIIGEWPGLAEAALVDGRDLRPSIDVREVFLGVLADHFVVDADRLAADVFRDRALRPVPNLVRRGA
ncbi:MAG: DUF1501 domain-containing protein [Gammaproteobacteria bacterium]|nr:DUF1501 domain-containing protein [Gammaproteobacteria bacterium]